MSDPTPVTTEKDATPPEFTKGSRRQWFLDHLWVHRPFYLWLPIVLLSVWGALHGYRALTGRAPVDDLPVGSLGNLLILIAAIILTNWTHPRLFGIVETKDEARWYVIAWDYASIGFTFWLCWFALSH